ncbi:hypothetical protein VNO77_37610 [Canavalia gladiata]|uniref:Uncharacterized protein n=1 Tax=Canavalia gladiata TaxID=3824 RepID=A0AAN9KB07_CANGL
MRSGKLSKPGGNFMAHLRIVHSWVFANALLQEKRPKHCRCRMEDDGDGGLELNVTFVKGASPKAANGPQRIQFQKKIKQIFSEQAQFFFGKTFCSLADSSMFSWFYFQHVPTQVTKLRFPIVEAHLEQNNVSLFFTESSTNPSLIGVDINLIQHSLAKYIGGGEKTLHLRVPQQKSTALRMANFRGVSQGESHAARLQASHAEDGLTLFLNIWAELVNEDPPSGLVY